MKVSMVFCEFRINGDQNSANKKTKKKSCQKMRAKCPETFILYLEAKLLYCLEENKYLDLINHIQFLISAEVCLTLALLLMHELA